MNFQINQKKMKRKYKKQTSKMLNIAEAKIKKEEASKYHWICEECGTSYSCIKNERPPGINWSDGHKCNPVPKNRMTDKHKSLNYGENK